MPVTPVLVACGKESMVQTGWPNEQGEQNIPSLSNSIRVQGPREVMSQLYRPPVLFALCRGSATARGAPTSNLGTKQKEFRDLHVKYFKRLARIQSNGHYSLPCSPLNVQQLRSWGQQSCFCSTGRYDLQLRHNSVPPRIGSSIWVLCWCWKTLFIEQEQNATEQFTPPTLGEKQPSCSI